MTTSSYDLQFSDLFKNCFQFSKLFQYRPKFPFSIETDHYVIKTAEKLRELYLIFKLRQEAFLLNDRNSRIPFLIDIDEHDFHCDHIVIIDKKTGSVCGTYRMLSSLTSSEFYGQTEFVLDKFLKTPGIKLELGRACIHPQYRNGTVIDLLWRGMARYIQLTNARFLFGCSSVKYTDPLLVGELNTYLKTNGWVSDDYDITPTPAYQMSDVTEKPVDEEKAKKLLPSLLRSYIQAGAFVHGGPALDLDFHCVDYFTILDLKNIRPSFARRYFPFL